MILAGTGPAGGEGIDKVTRISYLDTARGLLTRQDPKQFLFFTRTPNGRRAGKEFLARLKERTSDRDKAISVRLVPRPAEGHPPMGSADSPRTSRASTSRCSSSTVRATRWCPPRTPSTSIDDSRTASSSSTPTPGTAACSSSTRTSSSGRSSSYESSRAAAHPADDMRLRRMTPRRGRPGGVLPRLRTAGKPRRGERS